MDKGRRGHEFQIGLTMSGAISAGAYTAGVLDFLIEALDAWEDARNGPDADTVPGHRVGIKVMSGASAGAITAAIGAIALVDAEPDGKRKAPGAYVKEGFTYSYYMSKL
jgi:predicted acylesterase/phospholipase RssA